MILETTLRISHPRPDLRWTARVPSIERVRVRRYVVHTAILLIVALSAVAAL